jgi:hypothetical protein
MTVFSRDAALVHVRLPIARHLIPSQVRAWPERAEEWVEKKLRVGWAEVVWCQTAQVLAGSPESRRDVPVLRHLASGVVDEKALTSVVLNIESSEPENLLLILRSGRQRWQVQEGLYKTVKSSDRDADEWAAAAMPELLKHLAMPAERRDLQPAW